MQEHLGLPEGRSRIDPASPSISRPRLIDQAVNKTSLVLSIWSTPTDRGARASGTALIYDPRDLGALNHLVRSAVKDDDRVRLDSFTAQFVALSPAGERTLELRALHAVSEADSISFDAEETAAWFAILPFLQSDRSALDAADATLVARRRGGIRESTGRSSFFSAHNGVHISINDYLRGIIAARRGNDRVVSSSIAALEAAEGTEGARRLARQFALGVRAQAALASGDSAGASDILSSLEALFARAGHNMILIVQPRQTAAARERGATRVRRISGNASRTQHDARHDVSRSLIHP
jgi:hypothetical protein